MFIGMSVSLGLSGVKNQPRSRRTWMKCFYPGVILAYVAILIGMVIFFLLNHTMVDIIMPYYPKADGAFGIAGVDYDRLWTDFNNNSLTLKTYDIEPNLHIGTYQWRAGALAGGVVICVVTVVSMIVVTHQNIVAHQTEFMKLEESVEKDHRNSTVAKVSAHLQPMPSEIPAETGKCVVAPVPNDGAERDTDLTEPPSKTAVASHTGIGCGTGTGSGSASGASQTGSGGGDPNVVMLLQALLESQERTNKLLLTQIQHRGQFDERVDEREDKTDHALQLDLRKLIRNIGIVIVVAGLVLTLFLTVAMQQSYSNSAGSQAD